MSSGQGSGGQQGASSGASREANLKQRKYSTNQGKKSFGGADKSRTRVRARDEGDDVPEHIQKVRRIYSVAILCLIQKSRKSFESKLTC